MRIICWFLRHTAGNWTCSQTEGGLQHSTMKFVKFPQRTMLSFSCFRLYSTITLPCGRELASSRSLTDQRGRPAWPPVKPPDWMACCSGVISYTERRNSTNYSRSLSGLPERKCDKCSPNGGVAIEGIDDKADDPASCRCSTWRLFPFGGACQPHFFPDIAFARISIPPMFPILRTPPAYFGWRSLAVSYPYREGHC